MGRHARDSIWVLKKEELVRLATEELGMSVTKAKAHSASALRHMIKEARRVALDEGAAMKDTVDLSRAIAVKKTEKAMKRAAMKATLTSDPVAAYMEKTELKRLEDQARKMVQERERRDAAFALQAMADEGYEDAWPVKKAAPPAPKAMKALKAARPAPKAMKSQKITIENTLTQK